MNKVIDNIGNWLLAAVVVVASFHLWEWMGVFVSSIVLIVLVAFSYSSDDSSKKDSST